MYTFLYLSARKINKLFEITQFYGKNVLTKRKQYGI